MSLGRLPHALLAIVGALSLAGCATRPAVLPPPPGTEPEIADAERIGRIMFLHDVQAAHATDELVRIGVELSPEAGLDGWITVPNEQGLMVRFVRDIPERPVSVYDVTFSPLGVPTAHKNNANAVLPADQAAAYRARQTAIGSATLDCSDAYNTVVFRDPTGPTDDWHVYLLPATTVHGRIMVGRQLRFIVSADGRRIIESQPLSKGCMYLDLSDIPKDGKPLAAFVTNLVSRTPNESHVFLSLLHKLPIAVGTSLGKWMVHDGRIRYLGPTAE